MKQKCILLIGLADDYYRSLLFKKVLENQQDYKIIENRSLNRLEFNLTDFKQSCDQMKTCYNLVAIICFENLNPRPDTLLNDFTQLSSVFSAHELKNKLMVFFTFTGSIKPLKEIRDDFKDYDLLFRSMGICDGKNRLAFIKERVWILHDEFLSHFKSNITFNRFLFVKDSYRRERRILYLLIFSFSVLAAFPTIRYIYGLLDDLNDLLLASIHTNAFELAFDY